MAEEPQTGSLPLQEQEAGRYTYLPIPDETTIRILTLHPGSPEDVLVGELHFINLDEKPDYKAISYCWGDPTLCEEIFLDGNPKPLRLTQSIADALRRFRFSSQPIRLWADQICINQEDLKERSQQVELMNTIYKNTERVLVWLGRDKEDIAQEAFDTIKSLKIKFEDKRALAKFTDDQRERLHEFSEEEWWPLIVLYKLPWFGRIWVLQEIGTESVAILFWGEAWIDWISLFIVSNIFKRHHRPLRKKLHLHVEDVTFPYRLFSEVGLPKDSARRSFVYLLDRVRDRRAADPRDRVFALLGHFSARSKSNQRPLLEADYTKSANEIYLEVAICVLKDTRSLEVLNAVQHFKGENYDGLPTWVPRWAPGKRSHQIQNILGGAIANRIFRAAHTLNLSFQFSDSDQELIIQGLEIDMIETASERCLGPRDFRYETLAAELDHNPVRDLWQGICGYSKFDIAHRYVNGESALLAYCQTVTSGCIPMADRAGQRNIYYDVPNEHWLSHGAAYLTRAFGQSDLITKEVREASKGGDAFAWIGEAARTCGQRGFFRTKKGYYGIGPQPPFIQKGDIVCVFFGGETPYCLRPRGDHYEFLGECYVYGLMNGESIEMMNRGELEKKTFHIR